MKEKTAMQELLAHLTDAWSSPGDLWNPAKIIEKVESMLPKERQQMVDFAQYCKDNIRSRKTPSEHFTETYGE